VTEGRPKTILRFSADTSLATELLFDDALACEITNLSCAIPGE
jgi:hypothetical protein